MAETGSNYWRVRVFFKGREHPDDAQSREAAKDLAIAKLRELGVDASGIEWTDSTDASAAELGPEAQVRLIKRHD